MTLMSGLDALTRQFWRLTGRPVDLAGAQSWLAAPMHAHGSVGDGWLDSTAGPGGGVRPAGSPHGLFLDLSALDGPGFSAQEVRPEIRDFYEHTSGWRMEVWNQWSWPFQPLGDVVLRLFGRRVRQLAIPTRPMDVAHGMDSTVVPILDGNGIQHAAGWTRTLRSTGEVVYSGRYSVRRLPGAGRPSVHVAFPLPAGNVQVFLRPRTLPGGALELCSPAGRFGEDGAYVVVTRGGRAHAARLPIHETFRSYVDDEGVLRTDHDLRLWAAAVLRLHYKMQRAPAVR
jgi:hypothetical protein